jgi:hypothetical protein
MIVDPHVRCDNVIPATQAALLRLQLPNNRERSMPLYRILVRLRPPCMRIGAFAAELETAWDVASALQPSRYRRRNRGSYQFCDWLPVHFPSRREWLVHFKFEVKSCHACIRS